jgi:hypothetical protein
VSDIAQIEQNIRAFLAGNSPMSFEELALDLFRWQSRHIPLFGEYLHLIKRDPKKVSQLEDIPYLPISFFKTHRVYQASLPVEKVFTSSATGNQGHSSHYVHSLNWYHQVSRLGFEMCYGSLTDWHIFALLPSYLEREGSSLIAMVQHFLENGAKGGFYLHNHEDLNVAISSALAHSQKCLLLGVSFALLDFLGEEAVAWPDLVVMETGGMKGRKKEITREELHQELRRKFGVKAIHGEYGMTELHSQAYDTGTGSYQASRLMRVYPRSIYDPLSPGYFGRQAALNIVDLGNIYSCAFIATDDIGVVYDAAHFEIKGRLDSSDIRGCNLMVAGALDS